MLVCLVCFDCFVFYLDELYCGLFGWLWLLVFACFVRLFVMVLSWVVWFSYLFGLFNCVYLLVFDCVLRCSFRLCLAVID